MSFVDSSWNEDHVTLVTDANYFMFLLCLPGSRIPTVGPLFRKPLRKELHTEPHEVLLVGEPRRKIPRISDQSHLSQVRSLKLCKVDAEPSDESSSSSEEEDSDFTDPTTACQLQENKDFHHQVNERYAARPTLIVVRSATRGRRFEYNNS